MYAQNNGGNETRLTEADVCIIVEILAEYSAKWRSIGNQLGFSKHELDTVAQETVTQGPEGALQAMLSRWVQWTPQTDHRKYATIEDLEKALRSNVVNLAAVADTLREKWERAKNEDNVRLHFEGEAQTDQYVGADMEREDDTEDEHSSVEADDEAVYNIVRGGNQHHILGFLFKDSNYHRVICCTYLLIVLTILLCGVATPYLTTALWWYKTPSPALSLVSYIHTVPLQGLNDVKYIDSLFLQLDKTPSDGQLQPCIAKAMVLPSSDLSRGIDTAQFIDTSHDYWYLLKGSVINVTYRDSGTPASVWLFHDENTYNQSLHDKPQCDDSRYSWRGECHNVSSGEDFSFRIDKDSFYFIRCFKETDSENSGTRDCFYRLTVNIDVYQYNHTLFQHSSNNISVTPYNITSAGTQLTLNKEFDVRNYGSSKKEQSVLVYLPKGNSCGDVSHVIVYGIAKVKDAWLFTSIVVLLAMTALLLIIPAHCLCCKLKRMYGMQAPAQDLQPLLGEPFQE